MHFYLWRARSCTQAQIFGILLIYTFSKCLVKEGRERRKEKSEREDMSTENKNKKNNIAGIFVAGVISGLAITNFLASSTIVHQDLTPRKQLLMETLVHFQSSQID